MSRIRAYLEARFDDDAHVLASVLFEELVAARVRSLLPDAGSRDPRARAAAGVRRAARPAAVKLTVGLDHEPGEEMQLDWLELSETPWGVKAYVLVGALSHSGRVAWRVRGGESVRAPGRGAGRRAAPPGRHRALVADRSDGDVRLPGHATGCGRRRRRWPSTTASLSRSVRRETAAAQGCRREGDRLSDAVVVALGAGRHAGAGAGRSGPLVRRLSRIAAGAGSSTVGELAAGEPLLGLPELPFPAEYQAGAGRLARRAGRVRDQPLQRPARLRRPDGRGPRAARRACTWRSTRPPAPGSPGTAAPPPAPGRWSAHPEHARKLLERAVLERSPHEGVSAQAEPAAGRARAAPRPPACAARTPAGRGRRSGSVRRIAQGGRPSDEQARQLPETSARTSPTSSSPRSPSSSPPRSSRPRRTSRATPSSCTTCSASRSHATEQRRLDGRMRFAGLPRAQDAGGVRLHAQPGIDRASRRRARHPAVRPGEGERAADRPARCRARRCSPPRSASKPCRPATASTTPPPPTSSPAPPAPRSRAAGRPRCASGPDQRSSIVDELGYLPMVGEAGIAPVPGDLAPLPARQRDPDDQPWDRANGARSSRTRPSPPRSSTACCTTRPCCRSTATATACAATAPACTSYAAPSQPTRRPRHERRRHR